MLWIKPGSIRSTRNGVLVKHRHTVVLEPSIVLWIAEVGSGGERCRAIVADRVVDGRHILSAVGILDVNRSGSNINTFG